MSDLRVTAYPGHISIFTVEGHKMPAVCQASQMPDGSWFLNRLLVSKELRGKGLGSELLEHLKTELKKQECTLLVVFPGGYDSDPERQWRFYAERGFTEKTRDGGTYLEWRPT